MQCRVGFFDEVIWVAQRVGAFTRRVRISGANTNRFEQYSPFILTGGWIHRRVWWNSPSFRLVSSSLSSNSTLSMTWTPWWALHKSSPSLSSSPLINRSLLSSISTMKLESTNCTSKPSGRYWPKSWIARGRRWWHLQLCRFNIGSYLLPKRPTSDWVEKLFLIFSLKIFLLHKVAFLWKCDITFKLFYY